MQEYVPRAFIWPHIYAPCRGPVRGNPVEGQCGPMGFHGRELLRSNDGDIPWTKVGGGT